jgi:hypothetical protein
MVVAQVVLQVHQQLRHASDLCRPAQLETHDELLSFYEKIGFSILPADGNMYTLAGLERATGACVNEELVKDIHGPHTTHMVLRPGVHEEV